MEAESRDHQADKSARSSEESKVSEEGNGDSRAERGDGERAAEEAKTESNRDVAIDVTGGDNGGSGNSESSKAEKMCRICQLGSEESPEGSQLIPLGCDCRGELGVSHKNCAEAWFSLKGNRLCEICGKTANNISSSVEETSIYMMERNEMRLVAATLAAPNESRWNRSLCNFLLGCLVVAFFLPWFYQGIDRFL